MKKIIYTDGACSGNPGPGGWAWAIEGGASKSGADPKTTNQRMELMAVLDALESNDGPLEIVSDSTYVVNCFRDRWYAGWLKRGWVNSKNQPVANRDIWEPLIENYLARKNVSFRWVKGHSGHPMNDLVDQLAVRAAQTKTGHFQLEPKVGTSSTDSSARGAQTAAVASETVSSQAAAAPAGAQVVVIFRAELREGALSSYQETAERMRALALGEFGCLDFYTIVDGSEEVALSYWPDESSVRRFKAHAEHLLAQESGRHDWYENYRVDVARIERSYTWPLSGAPRMG